MTEKRATKIAARALKAERGGKYQRHLRTVGGGGEITPHPKPWTCDKCKQPIASAKGYILVMDAESHSYPQKATSTEVELTEEALEARRAKGQRTEPPFGTFSLGEVKLSRSQIEFAAFHHDCDPYPGTDPYRFSVESAKTLEAWTILVHHLCEKTWMSTYDIRNMLGFWFENRGQDPYQL